MSSIERAKCFMQRRARLIALTAVPLASLVGITPAKAIMVTPLVLDPGMSDSCSVVAHNGSLVSGGTTSSCSVAQLAPGANGVTGIKMFGNGNGISDTSGSFTLAFRVLSGTTNSGFLPAGSLPVSWAFSIADSNESANLSWTITVGAMIEGLSGTHTVFTDTESDVATGPESGLATATIPSPGIGVLGYTMNFLVTDSNAINGETLSVTIPNGSTVDVNPGAPGVPEPGTFALLGPALAALGSLAWWRRATSNTTP